MSINYVSEYVDKYNFFEEASLNVKGLICPFLGDGFSAGETLQT